MTESILTFGRAFKVRRQELGHSANEAAEICQTTQATISRWETGRNYPSAIEQQVRVANYLGVTNEVLAQLLAETIRRNILADIQRHLG